ncbi:MAG: pyridoxal phosphate-dependent aminotransferase [Lachnospiraceae bacterium]|nr:pyridoxal phosphate-dependent aminotransferase [Lachnospiraceae bacterium]
MTYDFDQVIERRGTDCLKYDFAVERGRPSDVLPLWVADMDFRAPQCVLDALKKNVELGIFGYSDSKEDYVQAVTDWFSVHFNWKPQKEWLVKTPGVVFAIAMAVKAVTEPGEAVLIQPPVYYPFFEVIRDNDRSVVENELIYENGQYHIDFDDFERKIAKNKVRLFLLCSPHNPVGRVWKLDELQKMGAICEKYDVTVVSDEIHCDFAFDEHPHTPFAAACPSLAEKTILCTSVSKSFNLAGLQVSNIFIPGRALREKVKKEIDRCGYSQLNMLGLAACKAAYQGGEDWLKAVKAYMRENLDFLRSYLQENLPQIRLAEPQGTYFAWLDCSGLGLPRDQLDDLVVNGAKLWLDSGHVFGENSSQFQRVVLACPRSILKQALDQLKKAVEQRK